MTDRLWLSRLRHLVDILLEMNEVSLLLPGKLLAVFVASYKVRLFKHRSEFGKTCICHLGITASQRLDFSEIGDGI